ncbi:hypothetical protein B296_00008274 [Ensete ventricosum]|uniref:Uncharacterized protein n=1 Tax=Ensete ventricosum TaxID=4639 RepID=A0A427B5M2_ENSVE|nr:hypothetical protein B296_00008274 [Ensete ventricosum]
MNAGTARTKSTEVSVVAFAILLPTLVVELTIAVASFANSAEDDPYLQLVEDSKLQAANAAPERCSGVYGSQEDDNNALKSLQAVELTESQSREFIVSLIMNSLSDLSDVLDTALQVGRFSVSTTSGVPFKEMAGHCEALTMGKHQKMSVLTGAQQKHDILLGGSSTDQNVDKMSSCFNVDQPGKVLLLLVQSNNPFLDEKLNADVQNQFGGNNMILYQPQCLRLPASSPYDHFLKAAGC